MGNREGRTSRYQSRGKRKSATIQPCFSSFAHFCCFIVLRAVAENKVRWAFWPPGYIPTYTDTNGIWIMNDHPNIDRFDDDGEDDDDHSDVEEFREQRLSDATTDDASDSDGVEVGTSRFSILKIEDEDADNGSSVVRGERSYNALDHRNE